MGQLLEFDRERRESRRELQALLLEARALVGTAAEGGELRVRLLELVKRMLELVPDGEPPTPPRPRGPAGARLARVHPLAAAAMAA